MHVLVTGGSSGLGEAIVKKLAGEGYRVSFTYARSADKAKALAASLENVTALHCDFTDDHSVTELVAQLKTLDLDGLVNNAYTEIRKAHFHKADANDFLLGFRHNVMPVLRITQESISLFRKKKYGRIVNVISSANLNKPPIGWSDYVACKAYLLSMSRSWATENIRFNISSNSISPAFMQTSLTADTDERVTEEMISGHPLKQLLTPAEVAESVSFLLHAPAHINGINLVMNAGNDLV